MNKEIESKLLKLVKDNYQEIADNFNITRQKEIWPEMRRLAENIQDRETILDVGCGNGRFLEAIKSKQVNYLGVDNSSAMIELAKRNYPGQRFLIADILQLDTFPENNFSKVFCLAVLQHLPGRDLRLQALAQLAGKLKPGGELIISVWNLWRQPKYRALLFKNFGLKILHRNELGFNDLVFPWKNSTGEVISQRYYHAFTKKELKRLVRLAGLTTQRLVRDKYNYWLVLKNKQG